MITVRNKSLLIYSLLTVISISGCALVWFIMALYDIGVSSDSVYYIIAANNFANGNLMGVFLLHEPPLYPVLLAIFIKIGFDLITVARIICTLSFGTVIFLSGLFLWQSLRSLWFTIFGALCILISMQLIAVCTAAMTEPLFLVLTLVFIICMSKFLGDTKSRYVWGLAGISALAILDKYIGVAFLMAFFIMIVCYTPDLSWKKKLSKLYLYFIISLAPIALWMFRSHIITETIVGKRMPSELPLVHNGVETLKVLGRWILPFTISSTLKVAAISILIILLIGYMIGVLFIMNKKKFTAEMQYFCSAGGFFSGYVISIIGIGTVIKIDSPNDRLLSPLYPCVLFFIIFFMRFIIIKSKNLIEKRAVRVVIAVAIGCVFIAGSITRAQKVFIKYAKLGANRGYYSTVFKQSPTIRWLKEHPFGDGIVYTNETNILYLYSNIIALPVSLLMNKNQTLSMREPVIEDNNTFLVLFHLKEFAIFDTRYSDISTISPEIALHKIAQFPDGEIYQLTRRP